MLFWKQIGDCTANADKLRRMLTSSIIDARLIATKTFKKSIYISIDELVQAPGMARTVKLALLNQATRMLYDSLSAELRRNIDSNRLGAHPPTVRRLSRCLLECLYAGRALGSLEVGAEELWMISDGMIGTIEIRSLDPDDKSLGNAIEIMSLSIALSSDDAYISGSGDRFSMLADKLNDPLSPWRVRHSVALAIKTSGYITSDNPASPRFAMQRQVLKLLQDSDPDVRFVAANSMTEQSNQEFSAALLALERAYTSMCNTRETRVSSYLLASLAENWEDTETRMEQIISELAPCENADEITLLNTDTTRKIFEDEDPNPYEEPLLACHFAVSSMIRMGLPLETNPTECSTILKVASSVLKKLKDRYSQMHGGVLHDITRYHSLFPGIQGIFVTCTAILYMGGTGCEEIQKAAASLLSLCERGSTMHPEILEALKVLAEAKASHHDTRKRLLRLCFLVPCRAE